VLFWGVTGFALLCALALIIAGILHATFKPPTESDIMNEIRRERGKAIEKRDEKEE
jgi:hypothetical protein